MEVLSILIRVALLFTVVVVVAYAVTMLFIRIADEWKATRDHHHEDTDDDLI